MARSSTPACLALAEAFDEHMLLGESEVVTANERGPLTAAYLLDGLDALPASPRRSVLRLCVATWEADTAEADARIASCLAALDPTDGGGCYACALDLLRGDGPCDAHGAKGGGA